MAMKKISMKELKPIVEKYKLNLCRVIESDDVVLICKRPEADMETITFRAFEQILEKKGLAVYKAEGSDFLKIMKDK